MLGIFKKKEPPKIPYDPAVWEPALRSSICTGEMVVGFLERGSDRFREYELARDQGDVESFCKRAGIEPKDLKRIY